MYRLNEQQTAIVEEVRQIADQSIAPQAADVDAAAHFPHASIEALEKSGFLGLNVPTEYGGMGQGLRVACAMLDQIAQRCASTALIYLMHLCGTACYTAYPAPALDTLRQMANGNTSPPSPGVREALAAISGLPRARHSNTTAE